MGLFNNITKSLKKAAPVIGGVIGFGLTGTPIGASIGSGIGGLVAGQDVEDALKTAAIGGALGFGASKMGFTAAKPGGFLPQFPSKATQVPISASDAIASGDPGLKKRITGMEEESSLFGGLFDDMTFGQKAALGLGALGAAGLVFGEEEEEERPRRPFPEGEMFDITSRSRETGETLFLTDPEDLAQYKKELSEPFLHGGEVHGPGTGTSDSVPARLSDGEFVMTAAAVRGAGGGDRDIGAARMYDMMAELEAQA